MGNYRSDSEWFELDRKYNENLKLLSQLYGISAEKVMAAIRGPGLRCGTRDGVHKMVPKAVDFPNYMKLTDPELAELIVHKISEKWDELEDCPDFLRDSL